MMKSSNCTFGLSAIFTTLAVISGVGACVFVAPPAGATVVRATSFNERAEGQTVAASKRIADESSGRWSFRRPYGTFLDLLPANRSVATTPTTSAAAGRTQTTPRHSVISLPSTTRSVTSPPTPATTTSTFGVQRGSKVLVVVEENHTQAQAEAHMPYMVSMQKTYGLTTHYTASTHPSLPNYLEIAGGSTFGVTNDAPPSSHPVQGRSVFGAALAAGMTARTYNETMTRNCQTHDNGKYAVKHNPWAYFAAERAACRKYDVPLAVLADDISSGNLPNVGMLTPNLCNDAHDCPLRTADAFLKLWLPRVMRGPDYTSGKLTIVVTFDEGVRSNQTIGALVINPALHHKTVSAPLTHAALSRWLYRVSGSKPQNRAAKAVNFGTAFGL